MMTLIIPLSVFGFVVLAALGGYWLVWRPSNTAAERLEQMGRREEAATLVTEESTAAWIGEKLAQPINRFVPPSAAEARKLQKKLMHAGYFSPRSPMIYRALQTAALVGLPLVTALVLMALGRSLSGSFSWLVGAVGAGYLLPRIILDNRLKGRQQRLQWGLADALDLLVISIEAGLGLNAAMVRVSEELKGVHPDICKEFEMVNLQIRVGGDRETALRELGERTGVDDLRGLCAILIQADRFGTSIARAVRIYSESMRTKRRQRAEQAAQKAAVKLLFPLAVFLFPTLFIAILGPAALQMMDYFGKRGSP